jgi:hypothetical protein
MMEEAMDVLNERERDILTQRRLQDSPVTLEDLSGVYNVSRERIRQIEVRAFEKLQKRMRELAKEQGMLPRLTPPTVRDFCRPRPPEGAAGCVLTSAGRTVPMRNTFLQKQIPDLAP